MKKRKIKVALGLSGGVDSAVSAYLLKSYGYDVHCVYLNCFDSDTPGCRGDQDRKDALAVAMHLGLPFQVLDFRKAYQAAVIDYFKKEYLLGRTPNPDVVCNRDIKFGLFLDWAVKAGFDAIATGHYAKIVRKTRNTQNAGMSEGQNIREPEEIRSSDSPNFRFSGTPSFLSIPKDLRKDQTYFLWAVPRQKFKRVLFPLGDLLKTKVREIASKIGLPVAKKKDSTGICFVGEVRVEDFLKRLGVKEKIGEVVIKTKDYKNYNDYKSYGHEVIGHHRGVWFYTVGQRHGFSTDLRSPKNKDKGRGTKDSLRPLPDRPPLYVIEKDIKKNRLIVGFGAETYREKFVVGSCNWLIDDKFFSQTQNSKLKTQNQVKNSKPQTVLVRIRHGGELIPCSLKIDHRPWTMDYGQKTVHRLSSTVYRPLSITVRLRSAQRGIAAGQSAVFYSKDGTVVGGGIIQ